MPPTKKKPLFGASRSAPRRRRLPWLGLLSRAPLLSPGFVDNAEVINSRAAMIGFFALILLEAVAGKGILELLGVETGNGIDIGF